MIPRRRPLSLVEKDLRRFRTFAPIEWIRSLSVPSFLLALGVVSLFCYTFAVRGSGAKNGVPEELRLDERSLGVFETMCHRIAEAKQVRRSLTECKSAHDLYERLRLAPDELRALGDECAVAPEKLLSVCHQVGNSLSQLESAAIQDQRLKEARLAQDDTPEGVHQAEWAFAESQVPFVQEDDTADTGDRVLSPNARFVQEHREQIDRSLHGVLLADEEEG